MSVERALRRIAEADPDRPRDQDREQQYEAYEKTLRALEDVTPEDDDEGITVVTEWVIEQIQAEGERPSSRAVRQRGREFCIENGYEVSDDDWLGA